MEYRISNKLAALKPSAIREIFKSLSDPSIIAFAAGNPAAESFPVEALAEITADIFANEPVKALQYGQTEGYPPLREAVNRRLAEKFSIGCSVEKGYKYNDTTLIVSGGNQGIELACKVLCNEGDIVLCEDPSFIGALNAFRSNGAITKGIPLRDDGIDTEILEATLAADRAGENRIKMLYLIPTFHNPAGITTSLEVRKKVYEIAVKYELVILEDNPYGELRFAGEEIPTIKSMDTEGLVLYCSSFSKILSAGMRIGFITGPEKLMQKMVVAKQVEDVHTNQLFQMLCHRFVTERDLDGHIEMIRAIYRRKCGIMMKGLDENLPKSFKFTRPEGGLFVWCTLPEGIDMTEFVARCLKNKLAIVPGTAFCPDENGTSNSVRFNYSTPSDEQIERGCVILGEVAREMILESVSATLKLNQHKEPKEKGKACTFYISVVAQNNLSALTSRYNVNKSKIIDTLLCNFDMIESSIINSNQSSAYSSINSNSSNTLDELFVNQGNGTGVTFYLSPNAINILEELTKKYECKKSNIIDAILRNCK